MKVVHASIHRVKLPLVHSFQTSSHRKSYLEHLIVKLVDADGHVGWGEIASPSDPYYCSETTETTWLVARTYLFPIVLGTEWEHPSEVSAAWHKVRGHEFAKAGVDAAVWTLYASAAGISLAGALGGTRATVKAGVSLGIEPTIDDLLVQVQKQVDAGYPRVKLKVAPGWDIEPVRAVKAAFGDHDIHVDANGAYGDSADEIAHLAKLDEFGLTMIEQPFAPRNFVASARLQARIDTPVCLDESVDSIDDLHTMLALKAGRVLNIKVSRMGGLTAAKAAHDIATDAGIPVWCGGMHEFGIGRAANVAISSLPGFTLPSDVSGSDKYYARDIIVPPVVANDGIVTVPTAPGLGFDVDEAWLAENRVDYDEAPAASASAAASQ